MLKIKNKEVNRSEEEKVNGGEIKLQARRVDYTNIKLQVLFKM